MLRSLVSAALLTAFSSAFAIVIRHDRDDAKYQALASKYKSVVCKVPTGGLGTLVDKNWVLTAAHVVDDMPPYIRHVDFDGKRYPVKAVHLHPSWREGEMPNDVALLELGQPVLGIKPVQMYSKSDETGKAIIFVGDGMTGDGNSGPTKGDAIWRAAENVITSTTPNYISFKFDRPPSGSELEGISGPGDSGGPALIESGDDLFILGTSGRNSAPRGNGHCTYESEEFYGRVSTALPWIQETMAGKNPYVEAWSSVRQGTPTSTFGKIAMEYLDAMNTANGYAFVKYSDRHWPQRLLDQTPAEERKKRAETSQAKYGTYKVISYSESVDGIALYATSSKAGPVMLWFIMVGNPPKNPVVRRSTEAAQPSVK